jgi:hypothetical protein
MKRLILLLGTVSLLIGWELKQNENPKPLFTYDEAAAFCAETPGWRLPTIGELFRLVHDNSEQILHKSRNYWAKTELFSNPGFAWQVLNPDKDAKPLPKSEKLNALCVPDTPVRSDLRTRYELKEKWIVDHGQNLLWQRIDRKERRTRYNHFEAAKECASMNTGGLQWRLPTLTELFHTVDFSRTDPAIDKAVFEYTYAKYYWTSDQLSDFSNEAYVVGFKVGSVAQSSKKNESFVRCVTEGKK